MSASKPSGAGLFDSLKVLASNLVSIANTRLDLLSTDIEEEWERRVTPLWMLMVGLFCLGVGVVLLVILAAVAFWDGYRLLVLSTLAGLFLLAGLTALAIAQRKLRTKPRLFTVSLAELAKDRQ